MRRLQRIARTEGVRHVLGMDGPGNRRTTPVHRGGMPRGRTLCRGTGRRLDREGGRSNRGEGGRLRKPFKASSRRPDRTQQQAACAKERRARTQRYV